MSDVEYLKSKLGVHPGFPKEGIVFLDIFPILRDPVAFEMLITNFVHHIFASGTKIDAVLGLDARGFLLGPIIAQRLGAAFVPVRKAGKLPGETVEAVYAKEYGEDKFQIQKEALSAGQNVIIVDDLIATGGSAKAAGELVEKLGAKTIEYLFIIEIEFLKGKDVLNAPTYSIIKD